MSNKHHNSNYYMKDENIVNIDTQSHCEKWTLKPLFILA